MSSLQRVGILTGGGDVPGLNACIKAAVRRGVRDGVEFVGIRRGWQGVVELDGGSGPDELLLPLTRQFVRKIDRSGGTVLHSSRTNPKHMKKSVLPDGLDPESLDQNEDGTYDLTPQVLRSLETLGLDALVVIGGDDTLSFAAHLDSIGYPTVGIPKTMDNDVSGTDYTIGFSTAITRSVDFITTLRTPAGSHERIAVIELFGRNSGQTALRTGYLSDADRTLICEVPFDVQKVAAFAAEDQDANPSHYCILVVSEGAHPAGGAVMEAGEPDAYGHRRLGGVGEWLSGQIRDITGRETLNQRLGYLMRAGSPDSLDTIVALNFGQLAFDLLKEGRHGTMTALVGGRYVAAPLSAVMAGARTVDVGAYYDVDTYRPRTRRIEDQPMFLT